MVLEASLVALSLALSLALRPWRLLADGRLLTPLAATLALLPWLWALPALHAMPLQLQWSGACLVLLMLGWPLAIPVLCLAAVLAALISPLAASEALSAAAWLGVVPATLALAVGAALRRLLGTHPFIYVLGRAFLGSAFCLFAAGLLRQWVGHAPAGVSPELTAVAHWLMAWGDAVVTGMLAAIFVAYRPQWLATWSDALYLRR
ncbi:MAG TPA: hypothetical protein VKP68_18845 [Ramlibacter sp.]|nr:hypothetical protein [Ramlibacter sp.]